MASSGIAPTRGHGDSTRTIRATEVAWLLLCLDDDLYSHPKEKWLAERAGRDPAAEPAGIPILMRERQIGVDEAVTRLVDIRDRLVFLDPLHRSRRPVTRPDPPALGGPARRPAEQP